MSHIVVFAEVDDRVLHDVSLQCLVQARRMADRNGGKVSCVALGANIKDALAPLFTYGADSVTAADNLGLESYMVQPYRDTLIGWLKEQAADLVFFPGSTVGNDLAPAVAHAMGSACALDCDAVETRNGKTIVKRYEFDRKVMTHFAPAADKPLVVSFRDGVVTDMPEPDAAKQGEVQTLAASLSDAASVAKVLKRDVAKKTVNLKDAKIIVSGGAGVGTAENFAMIRELAEALGAEIGATRAVVDAGWLPADHQIGQTGATVRPDLYIACGISGAVQHRVGMMDARKIVAINIDANAPIFRIAHYKVVGDLKAVVPKLIKLLK